MDKHTVFTRDLSASGLWWQWQVFQGPSSWRFPTSLVAIPLCQHHHTCIVISAEAVAVSLRYHWPLVGMPNHISLMESRGRDHQFSWDCGVQWASLIVGCLQEQTVVYLWVGGRDRWKLFLVDGILLWSPTPVASNKTNAIVAQCKNMNL